MKPSRLLMTALSLSAIASSLHAQKPTLGHQTKRHVTASQQTPPAGHFSTSSSPTALTPGRTLPICVQTLIDSANPPDCLQASSVPTAGMLLMNGPDFLIGPLGEVGIRTGVPEYELDVNGEIRGTGRMAIGNSAEIGFGTGPYDKVFDLSHTISDFSTSDNWEPFRSIITLDSPVDLTGPLATYIYGQDFETNVRSGNASDYEYIQGPYLAGGHFGIGHIVNLGGSISSGFILDGTATNLYGAAIAATIGGTGSATNAVALDLFGGHRGTGGVIEVNKLLNLRAPFADQPISQHYGIFLEDQSIPSTTSYAIYSDGGPSFHRGNLGLGERNPSNILTVEQGSVTDPIADAWLTYSSARFKQNIQPIEAAMDKVRQLEGVRFDWKLTGRADIGLIAERVAEVVPEVVQMEADGETAQGVDYARLTALLVEAVKEQQVQIEALRAEIESLK